MNRGVHSVKTQCALSCLFDSVCAIHLPGSFIMPQSNCRVWIAFQTSFHAKALLFTIVDETMNKSRSSQTGCTFAFPLRTDTLRCAAVHIKRTSVDQCITTACKCRSIRACVVSFQSDVGYDSGEERILVEGPSPQTGERSCSCC